MPDTPPAINAQRLLDDLESLAAVGRTSDGGVTRSAMSRADVDGRTWFQQRGAQSGLEFRRDGAANLSAVLPSTAPSARTLLLGSHLDTVPNGGRFDGALGVLAALEVLRTVREAGRNLSFHLEAISFTDEEGHILPLFGSRAAAGLLTEDDLLKPRGGVEVLQAGMQRLGITSQSPLAARRNDILGYLEIHIEQGSRLEEMGIDLAVVTSIVGIRSFWLRFVGQAAHAGTMPMDKRADALWGALAFVEATRDLVVADFAPGVMNVGQLTLKPGAFNIVPAEVKLSLEFRSDLPARLDSMETVILETARQAAQRYRLELTIERVGSEPPALMDTQLMTTIESAADSLNLSHTRLPSFAGHDAQSISKIAPAAMIFVPSVNGISHNPREFTKAQDVINAANVMLRTVWAMSERNP